MINGLAQSDPTVAKWYVGVVLIMVIGAVAVVFFLVLALLRRWKQRQHKAIEEDKISRREMRSSGRVDAWSAGSERYVDHDKLPDELPYDTEPDTLPEDYDEDDAGYGYGQGLDDDPPYQEHAEPRDPYDLFKDKPYQDPDNDEDDEDFDDDLPDEDFDDDDEPNR